jgi:hypothetical protein
LQKQRRHTSSLIIADYPVSRNRPDDSARQQS